VRIWVRAWSSCGVELVFVVTKKKRKEGMGRWVYAHESGISRKRYLYAVRVRKTCVCYNNKTMRDPVVATGEQLQERVGERNELTSSSPSPSTSVTISNAIPSSS
jgi:hypothetical protein